MRRDSCRHGLVRGVDGDGVGGTVGIGVFLHHLRKSERLSHLGWYWNTYVAAIGGHLLFILHSSAKVPCITYHEGHLFSRNVFSSDDKVTLVLTIRRVEDDNKFTPFCIVAWSVARMSATLNYRGPNILNASTVSSIGSKSCFMIPLTAILRVERGQWGPVTAEELVG